MKKVRIEWDDVAVPPFMADIPSDLLERRNINSLHRWLGNRSLRPTYMHLESERRRRGITR